MVQDEASVARSPAPARPGPAAPPASPVVAGRPRHFPSAYAWLSVGVWRNWRGVAGALVGTWFYLPFAIVTSVVAAVVLGVVGFFRGALTGADGVPPLVADLPVLGAAVDTFLPRSGGVLGALVGVLLGLVLGFLGALLLFWVLVFEDDPVAGVGSVLGVAAAGLLVGALYTGYRVVCEPMILRFSGARRMSRRERALILPIVRAGTARLGLANHPPILLDDGREPNATAYTRHIVISQGLLDEFQYDPEVIGGVVCHELVHWRNSDPISAAFVRGVALPLYLIYAGMGWLTRRVPRSPAHALTLGLLAGLGWVLLWPALVTVKYFLMPLQAADARRAEDRADQGAVLAGHRDGLRRVLARLRRSFETGRNGWTVAVGALHPPHELRLERLEDPSRRYPLPDPDGPADAPAFTGDRRRAPTPE